jgi:hypothetical protein
MHLKLTVNALHFASSFSGSARTMMQPYLEHYKNLKTIADGVIVQNAYSEVNLGKLFANLVPLKS